MSYDSFEEGHEILTGMGCGGFAVLLTVTPRQSTRDPIETTSRVQTPSEWWSVWVLAKLWKRGEGQRSLTYTYSEGPTDVSPRALHSTPVCLMFIFCALVSWPAFSQQSDASNQAQDEATVEGTVISSSRLTLVVRSDDDQFHLFTWDRNTTKPRSVPAGARVRVGSDQGEQAGARHATKVTVLEQAQGTGTATSSSRDAAPVPPPVQNVENQIKRDARRWRLGARAGVGLDPELVLFGVHSQVGPVFSRNVFFRPNADFEWGEITDMVALNLKAVYRMRTTMRGGEWAPYFGGAHH